MADDQREGHSVHVEIQVLDRCLVLVFIDAVVDILAILVILAILAILAVIFGLTNFIILRVLVLIVFSNFLVVRLVA